MPGMTLDQLRARCLVLEYSKFWVLYGAAMSERVKHLLVVARDDVRAGCYTCDYPTQGRYVWVDGDGYAYAIDVMCRGCNKLLARMGSKPGLVAALAAANSKSPATKQAEIDRWAAARLQDFDEAIAALRDQLPETPPDLMTAGSASDQEPPDDQPSSDAGTTGGPGADVDDLLQRIAVDLGEKKGNRSAAVASEPG